MAQEFALQFYRSRAWIKCRAAFIAHRISEDGGLCQMCHDKTGYIVHHRTKLTSKNINDPNITLSFDNLMYVCHDCHNVIHFADWQHLDYLFDKNGQPIPPPIQN